MSVFNLVPRFMRTWPFLRRFYWQQAELDEAQRRARERSAELQKYVQGPLIIVPPAAASSGGAAGTDRTEGDER